jgi:hypothetical protein
MKLKFRDVLFVRDYSGRPLRAWQWLFRVLPTGDEAAIAQLHHRYSFLHVSKGVSSSWLGRFRTSREARVALERKLAAI